MTQPKTEMVTREGDEAIDTVMELDPRECTVREESSVWDCDLGANVGEDFHSDLRDAFWLCLQFRKQPERVTFRFYENDHGELDRHRESELIVQTGTPGEQSSTCFIFTPIR